MILPFNIEFQTQSNWCWAATSKSVSRFYSNLSPWTQCKVASAELSLSCCTSPVPMPCNVPWYLDRALTRTNNFVTVNSPILWQAVLQELQKGLVLGARIGWNGGGGHFMVIHGATTNGVVEYLHIDDPIYGKSVLPYSQFLSNYQGNGRWTHTYFTKKYSYLMLFKDILYNKKLLKPISDIKPHLSSLSEFGSEKFMVPGKPEEYNLPHYSYVLGLDEIKTNFNWPKEPKSLRLVELSDQSPAALYEVTLDEKNPELIQMNTNKHYFSHLEKSLVLLQGNVNENEETGELRLLKIPALNIEAFWLHYDNASEKDQMAPVKKFEEDSRFNWTKTYSSKEFSDLVKDLAKQIDQYDDLLGA
jgi:hypothetical protein